MQGYILFTSPALFMITAWFWVSLKNAKSTGFKKHLKYFILGLIIILPLRYSIERIKPFNSDELLARVNTHVEMKILRAIMPICSSCRCIRDDNGYWC
jgi:hypothetical protein